MLSALVIALLAQPVSGHPDNRDRLNSRLRFFGDQSMPAGYTNPQFEFAPPSGAGLTAECAGTAVTGTFGEVITFTRSSSAYCTKGDARTGLSNSSMVLLGNNAPRVMLSGNGSDGLLIERIHKNWALWSQAFDTALTWVPTSAVVAAPTVTANAAVAPDGTTTAERVQFPAVGALGNSLLVQTTAKTGVISTGVYVKGVYDGGLPDGGPDDGGTTVGSIYTYVSTTAAVVCQACPYTSGAWNRCVQEARTVTAVGNFNIGLDVLNGCSGAIAAQDVYLWQGDYINLEHALSPVVTGAATATYNNDVASTPYVTSGSTVSMAATVTWPTTSLIVSSTAMQIAFAEAINAWRWSLQSTTQTISILNGVFRIGGVSNGVNVDGGTVPGVTQRLVMNYDGTSSTTCAGGLCASKTQAIVLQTDAGTIYLGARGPLDTAGVEMDGIITNVCVDPVATRCR